jgi:redox-sensitive bicupin YhaK (pirin superfamily)
MPALQTLSPHEKDLGGGFKVRRLLPSASRQAVGPFVFFDHFGPITAHPGDNHDVRPHPHVGLATVTYLFEGAMMHRDSTGVVQRIEPGAINLMTAGRGIVHSERTPKDLLALDRRSHGLQLWLGVPTEREEDPPRFQHVTGSEIPATDVGGVLVRVLIGTAFGLTSPVDSLSPTLYLDLNFDIASGASLVIPNAAEERALYSVDHDIELDGERVPACTMIVLEAGSEPVLSAPRGGRIVLIGGAPLGHRFIVWNFVSSRKERIIQAQDDWEAFTSTLGRGGPSTGFARIPGETEFIPLPPRHI